MTAVGWLPAPVEELFGTEATAEESYDLLTVDVPPTTWLAALRTARDDLSCTYFDWLSAVDEPGTGFHVSAHVVALAPVRRLLIRTTVPHETPALPTAVDVYAGAAWHERETHEMFGVDFEGHPALDHLLLPETFEGHPLRKDFVLAARVAKAWPGAKEPGESDHGGPKRRQMLPPGVPDPNEWGPLKGQLPAAPARPARGAGRAAGERPVRGAGERPVRGAGERTTGAAGEPPARAAGDGPARAAGDRPVRRARSVSEGSVSQAAPAGGAVPSGEGEGEGAVSQGRDAGDGTGPGEQGSGTPAAPRRARSASEGSASQQGTGAAPPRRSRSAGDGSASQQAPTPAPAVEPESAPAADPSRGPASTREGGTTQPPTAPRNTDAPWHNARPAFEQPEPDADTTAPETEAVEGPDSPPTTEGPASENPTPDPPTPDPPTPDTPTGGPQ
ncbi:NADH-quinone oxidoreductase subunit C [Streptomyces sp. NBC_01288]|uniref:NADH-quinone oxidoreductase subunit C n=1 Tax=Streptomyces sp. NBC_01288 TaxID=2903814 RepID=UPI002E141AA6|nr:NADH-quinone oxidoreductase subunit C [Streptomyces sp. NBC_01288]